jgi:AbiU2
MVKTLAISVAQADFENELEIFRTEEQIAQQYFFAYLSVRSLIARNEDVLRMINKAPLFWATCHHAMLLAAFMALGRIFDQHPKSKHNIDKLMSIAERNITLFSNAALMARRQREGMTQAEAMRYVNGKYELGPSDLRDLRRKIAKWRGIYEEKYRDVRHKVFAHKQTATTEDANKLLRKANVEELKSLLAFLDALYSAFWELFHNGREPAIKVRDWVLPPDENPSGRQMQPGEVVYRGGQEALMSMLRGYSEA